MEKACNILQNVLSDLLLREENRSIILEELGLDIGSAPSQIVKDDDIRAFLLEIARIVSTNLVISLTVQSKLGVAGIQTPEVSKLSSNLRYFQGSEGSFWKVLEAIEPSISLHRKVQNEIEDLTIYDITRILESVHVITVYGSTGIYVTTAKVNLRLGEANSLKKHRGAFYTPEKITEFICISTVGKRINSQLMAINETILGRVGVREKRKKVLHHLHAILNTHIVDPACGPGAFLIQSFLCMTSKFPQLKRMVGMLNVEIDNYNKGRKEDSVPRLDFDLDEKAFKLHVARRCLYGVDLDHAAAEIASMCLWLLAGTVDREAESIESILNVNIKQGNSLISKWPVKTIFLDKKNLQDLLALRRMIATTRGEKRKSIQKGYDERIHMLEENANPTPQHKCGSSFFADFQSKKPFSWELEFPEVFFGPDGGFNCLVMNPPYDIQKPNRSEYINLEAPKDIQRLQIRELNEVRMRVREEGQFFRKSGQYELALSNVLNLYRLMIERALQITSENGALGFIVPSTMLCDKSASKLRAKILSNYRIDGIYDFPERARVFDEACQAVCVLLIDKAEKGRSVPISLVLDYTEELKDAESVNIPLTEIELLSARFLPIPRHKNETCHLIEKIHTHPRLAKIKWIKNRRGELDLTFYRDLISRENTGTRLIRGNHIKRYQLEWNPHEKPGYVRKKAFLKKLGSSIKANDIHRVRLTGQQICNMGQVWRLKFCFVEPGDILANSCNYITIDGGVLGGYVDLNYILALLNSRLLNWRFKLTSTNNHVNNYELDDLPIKIPNLHDEREAALYRIIIENVKKILLKGYNSLLEREIDCAIFILYGLTVSEMRAVMEVERVPETEVEALLLLAERFQSIITSGEVALSL